MKKVLYAFLILFPLEVHFLYAHPPAKSNAIIQYQVNQQGDVAVLRSDGTVEVNFVECASAHVPKELNQQIAFSEKGLWILQRDGSVFRWEKGAWLFLVQDPSVQEIVAIDRALFALRKGRLAMLYQYNPTIPPTWIDIKWGEGLEIKGLGIQGQNIVVLTQSDVAVIPREAVRDSLVKGLSVELKSVQWISIQEAAQGLKTSLNTLLKGLPEKGLDDVLPDDMPSLQEVIERIVSERADEALRDIPGNPDIPMTPGAARMEMIRDMAQKDALDKALLWHLKYHLQEGEYRGPILDALLPILLKSARRAAER